MPGTRSIVCLFLLLSALVGGCGPLALPSAQAEVESIGGVTVQAQLLFANISKVMGLETFSNIVKNSGGRSLSTYTQVLGNNTDDRIFTFNGVSFVDARSTYTKLTQSSKATTTLGSLASISGFITDQGLKVGRVGISDVDIFVRATTRQLQHDLRHDGSAMELTPEQLGRTLNTSLAVTALLGANYSLTQNAAVAAYANANLSTSRVGGCLNPLVTQDAGLDCQN